MIFFCLEGYICSPFLTNFKEDLRLFIYDEAAEKKLTRINSQWNEEVFKIAIKKWLFLSRILNFLLYFRGKLKFAFWKLLQISLLFDILLIAYVLVWIGCNQDIIKYFHK